MNSKVISFVAGLLVGAALCAVVLGMKTSPQPAGGDTATPAINQKIAALESELDDAKSRLQKATDEKGLLLAHVEELEQQHQASDEKMDSNSTPGQNLLAALFGGDGTNGIFPGMADMMKETMQQEVENRMQDLKEKLNLTPDQADTIYKLLASEMERGLDAAQRMVKGELKPEELAGLNSETNQDAQIRALLTPEQAAAYDVYQQGEKSRQARLQANSELLELQSSLNLTEEQQDKVFAVLFQQAQEGTIAEASNPVGGTNQPRDELDRKVEALRPVLTPEQLTRYQKQQEQQRKMIEAFLGKAGTNANVFAPGGASFHITPVIVPK